MTSALKVSDLNAFYGASQILFGLDFEVEQGRTVALLGRNGAGKSTTMKAIAGVLASKSGSVLLGAQNVSKARPHEIARRGLAYVPEDRQVFPNHSVEDNLEIAMKKGVDGQDDWPIARVFDVFPLLTPLRKRRAGNLSGGEQQMLVIARALVGNPTVLMLDEPSEGLAPVIVQQIGHLIRRLKEFGTTVLLAEQNMHFCLGVASLAVVIDKGAIVHQSDTESLRVNEDVRNRYLGL